MTVTPATPTRRLEVGDTAPAFSLPTADGRTFTLADHAGRSVVVYFYPTAMTPGCTAQACDFRDSLPQMRKAGYDLVGVSPDGLDRLRAFADRDSLTFPLASDPEHEVLEAYGAWGEKQSYGRTLVGVIRSTVVVGPDGRLSYVAYDVRASGHVARLRRELGLDRADA